MFQEDCVYLSSFIQCFYLYFQTIEPLNFNVERTETPPYYRLTSLKKQQTNALSDSAQGESSEAMVVLNKGQIHTKRHSAEDPGKLAASER